MNQIKSIYKDCIEKYSNNDFIFSSESKIKYKDFDYLTKDVIFKLERYKACNVGIFTENSIEYLVAYFSILLSGNVVVGLNKRLNKESISNLILHSEISCIVTDYNGYEIIRNKVENVDFIILDNGKISKYYEYKKTKRINANTNGISQIVFTSGTTGRPKGVCLSEKNIVSNCEQIIDRINILENDKMLVIIPFYYAYGNSLILSHFISGASLIICKNTSLPMGIYNDLKTYNCTSIAGVGSQFNLLLERSKFGKEKLKKLRYLTFAGEPIADWTISKIKEIHQGIDVYKMYGQTEATARISILLPEELEKNDQTVGKICKGMNALIIDNENKICNYNTWGELVVKGENIFRKYWNDEKLTKEKFIEINNENYMKTGDFALLDNDDFLYVKGRNDDMIKINGERIFPIEIEKIIIKHPKVKEVGVASIDKVYKGKVLGKMIEAFVITDEDVHESEINNYCKEYLTINKRPEKIRFVKKLPKTRNGKLKRKELINCK